MNLQEQIEVMEPFIQAKYKDIMEMEKEMKEMNDLIEQLTTAENKLRLQRDSYEFAIGVYESTLDDIYVERALSNDI